MSKHLAPEERVPKRMSLGRLILMTIGLAFAGAAAFVLAFSIARHQSFITTVEQSLVPDPQTQFGKDRILVLLIGKDYDYDSHDYEYSSQARSDVIKAMAVDFVNKTISEVAVPRDMDVVLPNGQENKINQALHDGGIKEAQAVVAKFLGIPPFDRYVVLRINAAKEVVNALGGIDIKVTEFMDYDDSWGHLHIHFHPGTYHMNGDQAVSYARFRHDACSDPCRIKRQQQVERAILLKLKANKLRDIAQLQNYIGIVKRNVDTNFTTTELLSLGVAFQNIPLTSIKQEQIAYVDTKDTPYGGQVLVPDDKQKQQIVQQLLLQPTAPEPSPSSDQLAAIAPASVRVDVKNGSGIAGQARKLADVLRKKGYVIGDVGNADSSDVAATEIHEHTTITFAGAKVRADLGPSLRRATVVTDTITSATPQSDVTIVVGKDYAPTTQTSSIK